MQRRIGHHDWCAFFVLEKGDTPLSASPQERVCEKGVIVV